MFEEKDRGKIDKISLLKIKQRSRRLGSKLTINDEKGMESGKDSRSR